MCWLLASTSLLLSICSAGVESSGERDASVENSGVPVPVTGIQGGSVLLQIGNSSGIPPGTNLREIRWNVKNTSTERNIVRVPIPLTEANLKWFRDEDKQRFSVPNHLSLRIESLTHEDTGQYKAEATSVTGRAFREIFSLTVYEAGQGPDRKSVIIKSILTIVMVLTVLILGLGLYLWRIWWKKKTETQRGSRIQAHCKRHEDATQYADIIHPETQENHYETIGQEQEAHTTVYSTVCTPGQAALT